MTNIVLVVVSAKVHIWAEPKVCLCWYIRLDLSYHDYMEYSVKKDCLYRHVLGHSTYTFQVSVV